VFVREISNGWWLIDYAGWDPAYYVCEGLWGMVVWRLGCLVAYI
jgi:hypothetical protein